MVPRRQAQRGRVERVADRAAGGFLPGYPVELAIDGTVITTLTADAGGTVGYTLDPAALGLAPGDHALALQSMLITPAIGFHSG